MSSDNGERKAFPPWIKTDPPKVPPSWMPHLRRIGPVIEILAPLAPTPGSNRLDIERSDQVVFIRRTKQPVWPIIEGPAVVDCYPRDVQDGSASEKTLIAILNRGRHFRYFDPEDGKWHDYVVTTVGVVQERTG